MPRLLDDRIVGLQMADMATKSYAAVAPGHVVQVASDGINLVIAPVPAFVGATGPTGPGVGSAGPTGPAGPSTAALAGLKYVLFDSPGSTTWQVPANVNAVIINAVAGGGGGGIGTIPGEGDSGLIGVTGQRGGNVRVSATVTPNSVLSITIGAGGAAQTQSAASQPGTATTVNGMLTPIAITCNGGDRAYAAGSAPQPYVQGSRASSSPPSLFTPLLEGYGDGGAGVVYGPFSAFSGQKGAVLIEFVQLG